MSSEQKPETWGYGLTWLVIIGLAVMVGYGAIKLRTSAKENYAALSQQKIEAEGRAKVAAAKEDARVKALQLLEDLGPQPTADDLVKGQASYMTCMACHGQAGAGQPAAMAQAMGSPNLAGMPIWYAEAQIKKIKSGIRTSPKAMGMKLMIAALKDEQIFQIAGYLSKQKQATPNHTLKGDAVKGKALFAACAACHGANAEGNASRDFRAAPLNNLPDWYIVEQVKNFKAGIRGTDPKDVRGAVMRTQALAVKTEQDMIDIAEYIKTLNSAK